VVQQAIEHIGRVAHPDIHHLGMERRVLVGDVGVERPPWTTAVFRVDMASTLGFAAGSEVLTIRRWRGAITPYMDSSFIASQVFNFSMPSTEIKIAAIYSVSQ
jgi:hypothetical protein